MRAAVFFVCLFFLLPKGHERIYAATRHNGPGCTPVQIIQKKQAVKFTGTHHDKTVNKDTDPGKKQEYIICENVEGPNNLLARKYRLLAGSYLTYSSPFILRYRYRSFKDRFIFCGLLSYKYILQRVLRI